LADEPFRIVACARQAIGNYIYCVANNSYIYAYYPPTDIYYSIGQAPSGLAFNMECPVIGSSFYCIDADKGCWQCTPNGISTPTWNRECDMDYAVIYLMCCTYNSTSIYAICGRDGGGNRYAYNQMLNFELEQNWVRLNNHARPDFGDVRFTKGSDGVTELNYWMEDRVNGDADFWVSIPNNLNSSGTTVDLYYGNSSATTTSTPTIFPFFDDFLGTSLNTTKWNTYGVSGLNTITVANSLLKINSINIYVGIQSKINFGYNIAFRARIASAGGATPGMSQTFAFLNHTGSVTDYAQQYSYNNPIYGWETVVESTSGAYKVANYSGYITAYVAYGNANLSGSAFSTFEIRRQSNGVAFMVDNYPQTVLTVNLPTDKLPIDFQEYKGSNYTYLGNYVDTRLTVDWVLARKYVSPEPSVTFGTEQTIIVSVNITPITAQTMDINQTCMFTCTSITGGTPPYTKQWCYNSTQISGANGTYYYFTPSSAHLYNIYCNATDSTGTKGTSNVVPITVNSAPSVTISPTSVSLDINQNQTFTSTVSGGMSPYAYQWFKNGTAVSGGAGAGSTYSFSSSTTGTFLIKVNVTDEEVFRTQSNTATATVFPGLGVTISPASVTMNLGESQLFTSSVSGGAPPYTYQWYLNGVLQGTNSTWTFTGSSAGSYTVYVEVTDGTGAQTTSNTATIKCALHYVAATNVMPSKTVIGQGYSAKLNVTVTNQGSYTETFKATVYANATSITSQNITLSIGNSATTTFVWNTTGFPRGSYTIKVQVTLAPSETNTANNTFIYGIIKVTIPGDINGDGTVDWVDLGLLGLAYGSRLGDSNWNPNADINGDGTVDWQDLGLLGLNYGKSW
jgi:hypothetical protein